MPRKRDKRKLDTRIKRVRLRKAEAELKAYEKARSAETYEPVEETDPEILELDKALALANTRGRAAFKRELLCCELLNIENSRKRVDAQASRLAEIYGLEGNEDLSKLSIPALKPYDTDTEN